MTWLNRRGLLGAGLGLGLSFLGRSAGAATDAGPRKTLVMVICRGAMDGLSVTPPIGDPDYAGLRGPIAIPPDLALKLDTTFALHPALANVYAMAKNGQARFAPAIATPDRARSHFEAQDVLESGNSVVYGASSGWLNRTLTALNLSHKAEGLAVGTTAPLILRGPASASNWAPGRPAVDGARIAGILADLYTHDPILGPAFARGLETEIMAKAALAEANSGLAAGPPAPATPGNRRLQGQATALTLGRSLAAFLVLPNGPDIAALSLDGFDTHANQGAADGTLAGRLSYLDALLEGLRSGMADSWTNCVVLCATEFGRTARINGTRGTDHGTASTALILGGGLKPGGMIGDWPGLSRSALFEDRDTAPTLDMRALFKGVLADHMGLDHHTLETQIFPDSGLARAVRGLV